MATSKQSGLALIAAVALTSACDAKFSGTDASTRGLTGASAYGYLADGSMPDSTAVLPPPPTQGSAEFAHDLAARREALSLGGSPRYALAIADADRRSDRTMKAFECALGIDISPEQTPTLVRLLAKVRLDMRVSAYSAKARYKRPRPYVAYNAKACAPVGEGLVRDDGSYPSARGAVGWAYSLVLSELSPERADALVERGRQFGESRVICDAEWMSDVRAGRTLAEVTVQRMHDVLQFREDLSAARKEVTEARTRGAAPDADCSSERLALAQGLSTAPRQGRAQGKK